MRPVRMGTTATFKSIRTRALAVSAAVALLALSLGTGMASADGGRDHRNAENTFTKWRTAEPTVAPVLINMAGVVGGDVGDGTFTGEVLSYTPGATTVIEALYHFHGSRHSFTASVHVEQTGSTNGSKAVISGVVTDGWLKGNLVEAGYTQITCKHDGISSTCFRGWLDILRGSKSSPRSGALHFTKDCNMYTGAVGSHCVITASSLKAIKVSSWLVYASPIGATAVDSDVVLVVGPGNRAFGHCNFDLVTRLGGCTFSGGTGKFTHFHARTTTTPAGPSRVWNEDGTYWFGHDGHHGHD